MPVRSWSTKVPETTRFFLGRLVRTHSLVGVCLSSGSPLRLESQVARSHPDATLSGGCPPAAGKERRTQFWAPHVHERQQKTTAHGLCDPSSSFTDRHTVTRASVVFLFFGCRECELWPCHRGVRPRVEDSRLVFSHRLGVGTIGQYRCHRDCVDIPKRLALARGPSCVQPLPP